MITEFKLSNFKAFGKEQTVPLKPITLVFGPNSAGKSSILHSLLFAHEAIRTGNLDIRQTQIGGDSVDLGGFEQLTHRRNRDNAVVLTFRMDSLLEKETRTSDSSPLDDVEVRATLQLVTDEKADKLAESVISKMQELAEKEGIDVIDLASGTYDYAAKQRGDDLNTWDYRLDDAMDVFTCPVLRRFEILLSGQLFLQASSRPSGELRIDRLSLSHPAFRAIVEAVVTANTTSAALDDSDIKVVEAIADELIPELQISPDGLLCRLESSGSSSNDKLQFAAISRSQREEDLSNQARLFLPRYLSNLVVKATQGIREFTQSLEYLGPLRCYPPRHISIETIKEESSSEGLDAWVTVLKDVKVRNKVNGWLNSEFLSSRYQLGVNAQVPINLTAEALETAFNSIVEKKEEEYLSQDEWIEKPFSDWDLKELHKSMMEEIVDRCHGSHERKLSLIDKRTGTTVSHRDIGVGVSQLLPVLVKAYARKNRVIAIEQPEIHLHPALQAEMADVFIESALGEQKNTFLLETHSEHLILRLLRRIRETADGNLPEGMTKIHPEDISILYVKPGSEGSQVIRMIPNTDGDFDNPWPDGFFPERANELF